MTESIEVNRICALNDAFRRSLIGGTVVMTPGVLALGSGSTARVLTAVAAFAAFNDGNDPHGEHDFGALTLDSERLYFKIDYYDRSLRLHSPDPADPAVTRRVLTIMLAEEY